MSVFFINIALPKNESSNTKTKANKKNVILKADIKHSLRMKKIVFFLCMLSICTACWQCKTVPKNGIITLSKNNTCTLADSSKAADLIIADATDNIFAKITEADMCIQMKKNYPSETFRSQILNDYMEYLQKDVTNFTDDEAAFVNTTMNEVYQLTEKVLPSIFPKKINILKTKGKHYGDGVYYTREDCIIVPADALKTQDKETFLGTMIHEVFHVFSRLNPEKRKELYHLIGFEHLGTGNLGIPTSLRNRVLLNPDGVDFQYFIRLQLSPDKEIKAIPIIYSNEMTFKKSKTEFFNYLKFELFEIKDNERGWEVVTKKDGSSTLNIKELPDFWRQIRDNTQYIIHPDEVMADNFMFLILSEKNKNTQNKFSLEGKRLLEEIKKTIHP
jgi:hypothetical protein